MSEQIVSDLEAAHDYRDQLLERLNTDDPASYVLPVERLDEAVEFIKGQYPGLDFTDTELKSKLAELSAAGVSRHESDMGELRSEVERIANNIGYKLHGGVSMGVIHGAGVKAIQQKVMLTEASVIFMTRHLSTLIYRLAKLLARTLPQDVDVDGNKSIVWSLDEVKEVLYADRQLQQDWDFFFMDYSIDPDCPSVGEARKVESSDEAHLVFDLCESMEWFVLSHEYGHHIMQHSLDGVAGVQGEEHELAKGKECQADLIGAHICMALGAQNNRGLNFTAMFNIGAVVILTTLDCIMRGRSIMRSGSDDGFSHSNTHPPLDYRLGAISFMLRHIYKEEKPDAMKEVQWALSMQSSAKELIEYIWGRSKKYLEKCYLHGIRSQ